MGTANSKAEASILSSFIGLYPKIIVNPGLKTIRCADCTYSSALPSFLYFQMKRGLFHASRRLLLRPCHHYRSQGRYALTMLSASTKRLTTSSSSPSAPNAPVSAITTAAPTGMTSSPVAFPPELEAAIRKVEVLGGKEALIPLEVREALARKWEVFITERSRPIDSRTQFVGNFVLILYVKSKDPVKVEEVRVLENGFRPAYSFFKPCSLRILHVPFMLALFGCIPRRI